ncbi:MAG: DUF1018 domain-containing protein [Candidatus Omnitrophica bacterium]|nr:DUF1018 domain-containing protein [Candidatus Omnitrophota bacterium]
MDKKKLAIIHIVKTALRIPEEEYRKILQEVCGVTTAKDLDATGFRRLMNYFVRSKYYRLNPYGLTIKQKLYIKYLAAELGWDLIHLNNFLHKYYHKSAIDELTKQEAIKAIESLKAIKQHQKSSGSV